MPCIAMQVEPSSPDGDAVADKSGAGKDHHEGRRLFEDDDLAAPDEVDETMMAVLNNTAAGRALLEHQGLSCGAAGLLKPDRTILRLLFAAKFGKSAVKGFGGLAVRVVAFQRGVQGRVRHAVITSPCCITFEGSISSTAHYHHGRLEC